MKEGRNIQIIEWKDMDKRKFYGYGIILGISMRFTIYPLNLIKTRLQAQEGVTAYKGTFDAILKIAKREGLRGFYRGFPISSVQVLAGQLYITTYETTKQTIFNNNNIVLQHLFGGFLASSVSQTIMVPVDIISQYQQMSMEQKKSGMTYKVASVSQNASTQYKSTSTKRSGSVLGQAFRISQYIIRNEGLLGLYRGYLVSLCTYGTNSAFYWAFYYMYSELLESFLPKNKGKLHEALRISASGVLSSATAIILTNPLDVVRTRYQLQVKRGSDGASAFKTFKSLIHSEGYRGLTKGMTARIAQSSLSSSLLVLGYEYIKKLSVARSENEKLSKEEILERITALSKS